MIEDFNDEICYILTKKILRQSLSHEQQSKLASWREKSDDNRTLEQRFLDRNWLRKQRRQLHSAPSKEMFINIMEHINGGSDPEAGKLYKRTEKSYKAKMRELFKERMRM